MPEKSIQIVKQGRVFLAEPGTDKQSASFPVATILPNNRWLCVWRSAPRKESCPQEIVVHSFSDDEGVTWSEPRTFLTPPFLEGRPGAWRGGACTALGGSQVVAVLAWTDHSHPELPFFDPVTQSLKDIQLFLTRSDDYGDTWSPAELIPTQPDTAAAPMTGPILLLPDGRWACQYETNKRYGSEGPWHHTSRLLFSTDQGSTWSDSVEVTGDPADRYFWWDQRPSVSRDGSLLNLFWTFDQEEARYLNVHASSSQDGQIWTFPQDIGVSGQPAPPVFLSDRRWLMVWIDRQGEPTIKARLSDDDGRTWPEASEIILVHGGIPSQTVPKQTMDDAWQEMTEFSMGYPGTTRNPFGEILVTYYHGETTDHTGIYWRLLRVVD